MPTLEWIGKDKVINHHQDVAYRVLERQYSYSAKGQTEADNGSGNMIIHGDNLVALKALLPQYEGKIRCIYIDPPYNTGNEKWVYNDNVNDPKIKKWLGDVVGREGEDLSRHDKWLCMMYPRLALLQKLLDECGVIFISIDSNELFSLKMICDEIFGSSNFVDVISWFKKASPSNDAQYFSNDVEYIIVYAKQKQNWKPKRLPLSQSQLKYYSNPDRDPRGDWNSATYTCNKSKSERPSLYYAITNPNTGHEIYPKETAVWKYSQDQTKLHVAQNLLYWGADGQSQFPRMKKFLGTHQGVVNRTLWHYDEVGHTQSATNEINAVIDGGFPTPKPASLVERVLQIAAGKDDIFLDSFAGSGTTAHAVLNLNKQDGGNRKFILVETEDYAETITAERVKRVIRGYGEGNSAVEGTGGDFSFYELGDVLLLADGNLNESVGVDRIRAYVYFMETKQTIGEKSPEENDYYLGTHNQTAYYFYYEPDTVTTLDDSFLATIRTRADGYLIYADRLALSADDLRKYNIVFKKIPRDISRL
ncbi:MAG TPA: site-specific DNA-methyltransferase [Clostridia bacterium]|nr:site-specific DNA-methyltransferase [Clostridia bacterium]